MRKRERENPCGVCGHYHKYEEGETCGVCGHRLAAVTDTSVASIVPVSAFPSEILPDFLYLGSYDNAARAELLKTQGISRVLNAVPACQNLYKNSFMYHCLQYDQKLPFDDAIVFLEQCEKDKAKVLVHCMTGKNRSPAIVVAYLMKSKGWNLGQSYQWVKERRPSVEINQGVYQQLQEYEQNIFGSSIISMEVLLPPPPPAAAISFGFSRPPPNEQPSSPFENSHGTTSILFSGANKPTFEIPKEFVFGAGQGSKNAAATGDAIKSGPPVLKDIAMD
ncbi:hypothetical protein M569_11663, partial [Genlisea aurea]